MDFEKRYEEWLSGEFTSGELEDIDGEVRRTIRSVMEDLDQWEGQTDGNRAEMALEKVALQLVFARRLLDPKGTLIKSLRDGFVAVECHPERNYYINDMDGIVRMEGLPGVTVDEEDTFTHDGRTFHWNEDFSDDACELAEEWLSVEKKCMVLLYVKNGELVIVKEWYDQ